MVTKYPQRKYRRGVVYVTLGIKEPRIKNNWWVTEEFRKKVSESKKKMWQEPGKLAQRTEKQIERKHPWRQAFGIPGKPSPDYKIKTCAQ